MVQLLTEIMVSRLKGHTENVLLCPLVVKAGEIFYCLNTLHFPYYLLLMQSWITIEQNK